MKKQFTLIELLIVIAIIAILAGMLLPALSTVKENGRKIVCTANQKQVMQICSAYMNSFGDIIPPMFFVYHNDSGGSTKIYLTNILIEFSGIKAQKKTSGSNFYLPDILFCPTVSEGKTSGHSDLGTLSYNYDYGYIRGCYGRGLFGYSTYYARFNHNNNPVLRMGKVKRPSGKIYLTEPPASDFTKNHWQKFPGNGDGNGMTDSVNLRDMLSGRHNRTTNVTWLDGHVSSVPGSELTADYSKNCNTDVLKSASSLKYWYY